VKKFKLFSKCLKASHWL